MTDPDALIPLYEQVRRRILAEIDSGRLSEGSFLPPEPDLCASHGVSRITLRRAIGELCAEGRLIRQQGRGTLVAPRKVRQTLVSLSGFSETIEGMGRRSGHRILGREDHPPLQGAALRLGSGAPIRFLRLLEVDNLPMTLETLWFDAARFPGVVSKVAAGGSLFAALRETAGVLPASAERQIDVGFASHDEREIFGISAALPVYRVEKITCDAANRVIAVSHLVTPCHLVSFHIKT